MNPKQAFKVAFESNNPEFNYHMVSIDNSTVAGCFHFIVDGQKFVYSTDGTKVKCQRANFYSRLTPVVIS